MPMITSTTGTAPITFGPIVGDTITIRLEDDSQQLYYWADVLAAIAKAGQ